MKEIKKVLFLMSMIVPLIMIFVLMCVMMGGQTASTHESITIVSQDGFAVPFSKGVYYSVTSSFGYRVDPVYKDVTLFHSGLDLATSSGTDVLATADGVVYETGYNPSGLGNYVYIKHNTKKGIIYSGYGHMLNNSIVVRRGDQIKIGQKIGKVGSTGKSTGPHLHFMIMKGKVSFNPKDLIDPKYIVKGLK